jgi:3D-(3,5/4)-trihydroxycyclohexane-1,2-dione acylhydrolase (decyclizing)
VRADDRAALRSALDAARAADTTTVIHCPVVAGEIPASGAFWDLGVPEAASDEAANRRFARELDRRRAARQRPLP